MGFLSLETISNRIGIVQFLPLADKRNIQSQYEYRLVFVSSLNAILFHQSFNSQPKAYLLPFTYAYG
jgi:hypothetical protein